MTAPGLTTRLDNDADAAPAIVRMREIVKRFPGVVANDGVDFSLRPGEVHALLGENGAGKSTLMSILCGLYRPDEGELAIDDHPVRLRSPRDAIEHGIGMVHQHFMLAGPLTVAENVILGLRQPRFVLGMPKVEARLAELAAQLGLAIDARAPIWQLSVGEQQRVEILKMLYRGARILILDEPTAVLAPQEIDELFVALRAMAAGGRSIIIISHKLDEVLRVADRITVLRRGKVVAAGLDAHATDKAKLAHLMVGRPVAFDVDKRFRMPGAPVLELEQLHADGDKGLPALRGVSLLVRAGQIVGIAGVAGNGQRELAEVIVGLRPATGGQVRVAGRDVTGQSVRAIADVGVAYVPEDRTAVGSAPRLSVAENLIVKCYRQPQYGRRGLLNRTAIEQRATRLVAEFEIAASSIDMPAGKLSGGNLQRVILARETASRPRLLVAGQPTRGLDVGATETVRRLLLDGRNQDTATLLISEDLDELMALTDRLAVMYGGRIVGEMETAEATAEIVGLMMAGAHAAPAQEHA